MEESKHAKRKDSIERKPGQEKDKIWNKTFERCEQDRQAFNGVGLISST